MIRATDTTLVVSDSERAQVERDVPGAKVLVVPNDPRRRAICASARGSLRDSLRGGFEHPPNVDAALRLVKEVMPVVWRELGDVQVDDRRTSARRRGTGARLAAGGCDWMG